MQTSNQILLNQIYQASQTLSYEQQQQLLTFIEHLKQPTAKPKNPAKALLESDFIGCGKADPELSTNYKQAFADILEQKYADH